MMDREKARKLALPLSFTTLLTLVFLAIAALAGAYVWGVMSGRHGDSPGAESRATTAPQPQKPVLPEPDPEILKARELEFAHALKGEVRQPPPPPKVEPAAPDPKPAEINKPGADAPGSEGGAPAREQDSAGPTPQGQLFDYTFQMAALKDEQSVDNLRQRLEGRGMRTRMEKSGKLYLVFVLLRGDEQRAAEIVQTARELRLGEPLLRGRKPVAP